MSENAVQQGAAMATKRLSVIGDSDVVMHSLAESWPDDLRNIEWPHTSFMGRVPSTWKSGKLLRCTRNGLLIGTLVITSSDACSITYEPVGD